MLEFKLTNKYILIYISRTLEDSINIENRKDLG